ncbi:adenylate cyclase type 9 isoform X1 [Neodiprion virginianus]|uniref:adenylate cyclase type 9 isoform X1 n=1 Tax=Neodiprion virginianus TaxID=2961670 RepID=UPI001EE6CC60|nr:adenylate cyclase type 9 isoform X1 [Neodiprion virginianus]XP_046625231.1 adenylate cyclase type 9 isoform X1 [Neodiprion virginianus]
MTPPLSRKRGSSVSFTRAKDDEDTGGEIQISLAPYIQTYLAHSGQGSGCCGIGLPIPFERAAPRSWWHPKFDSEILEDQFKRSAYPQIRLRFRYALGYILLLSLSWLAYFIVIGMESTDTSVWPAGASIAGVFGAVGAMALAVLYFTHTDYYRFYVLPTSLLVASVLCFLSLLFVALVPPQSDRLTRVGHFALCTEILLLIYTVIPMPLYACVGICSVYSFSFEFLTAYFYNANQITRSTDYDDIRSHNDSSNQRLEWITTEKSDVNNSNLPTLIHSHSSYFASNLSNPASATPSINLEGDASTWIMRILMQVSIHLIGLHILIMTFVRMRGTFMKVGQSLLVRRQLEMEKQLKEKMIHSVMPPKVASWLMEESEREREREDSLKKGSIPSNNSDINSLFRPFNMHSMENVSILFADIVGFTRMSSNKTAEELVAILNDLFERFDELCAHHGCEKISTLGDCYYCVSGCPEPRADHAGCCVEMGLAMIEAIKQFDIERREGVNMRVGVHTGTVLCGIVGTKRFKFDVWSNDVTLANKLESTGKPGRVHLSEATMRFLGDIYLTEDGDAVNGVKSYFIRGRKADLVTQFMTNINKAGQSPTPSSSPPAPHNTRLRLASCTNQVKSPRPHYLHMVTSPASYRIKANSLPSILDSDNDGDTGDEKDDLNKSPTSIASYGKKKVKQKPWRYLQRQRTTEEMTPLDKGEGSEEITPSVKSSRVPTTHYEKSTNGYYDQLALANGIESDPMPVSNLLLNPSQDPASQAPSICSRKDSGIRSTSRRSSIQQQLFLMNGMAQGDILGHRVSGYYTSSQSTLNSTQDQPASAPQYPSASVVTDSFGACFHKLRKQSDLQLIRCVQDNVSSQRSYFVKPPLSSLTLFFKNKELEQEYRETAHKSSEGVGDNPPTLATSRFNTYFDILISALVFTSVTISLFLLYPPTTYYIVFSTLATLIHLFAVSLCIRQILHPNTTHTTFTQKIFKFFSKWHPWHICGGVLVSLPIISILINLTRDTIFMQQNHIEYYYSYLVFVGLVHFCNFTQLNCWMKNLLVTLTGLVFIGLIATHISTYDDHDDGNLLPQNNEERLYESEIYLDMVLLLLLVWFLNREFEISYRLSFHGNAVAARDKARVQSMKNQADWLLHNIIPKYVADQLKTTAKYSQNHKSVGIIFASIVNFNELYDESYLGGKEYLRVLNELIGDFDELLEKSEFSNVEKIKTIGSTFMAASGLNPQVRQQNEHKCTHLFQLLEFAVAMHKVIYDFNRDLLGFKLILRIGYNYGDVTAGVIGATKLYYDIWGDAVNIASRMDSTGVAGRIQLASNCLDVLAGRYDFEPRGQVYVKGKDNMDVFLLIVKGAEGDS